MARKKINYQVSGRNLKYLSDKKLQEIRNSIVHGITYEYEDKYHGQLHSVDKALAMKREKAKQEFEKRINRELKQLEKINKEAKPIKGKFDGRNSEGYYRIIDKDGRDFYFTPFDYPVTGELAKGTELIFTPFIDIYSGDGTLFLANDVKVA